MSQDFLILLLVTLTSLLVCFIFSVVIGLKRRKHKIAAPAMVGHPEVESAIRVHYNTIEQIILFLPSLWMFWYLVSPLWANILGMIWIVGRVLYALGYYNSPLKRYPGHLLTLLPLFILMFGSMFVIIAQLVGMRM
ncbi:MAG: MAPEG family protein [Candidatus Gracilibacteria bacterium]